MRNAESANGTVILLVGYPGCGKGTQGSKILEALDWPSINVGDECRNISPSTELGQLVHGYSSQGLLVPDQILLPRIYRPALDRIPPGNRVDDGVPRNINQYQHLRRWTDERNDGNIIVFNIEVSASAAKARMESRRRKGETIDVIDRRIEEFERDFPPLRAELERAHDAHELNFITIGGERPLDTIFKEIYEWLKQLKVVAA
ncbi:MAG: nucleoside monophosphate kinase [Patescibacteria group bacterium]